MKNILISLTFFFLLSPGAQACKCVPTTPEESFNRAAIVFKGSLVSEPLKFLQQGKTTLKVSEIWKGEEIFKLLSSGKESIELDQHFKSSCSFYFEQGKEYIVYALINKEGIESSQCTSTAPIDKAQNSLNFLKDIPSERLQHK